MFRRWMTSNWVQHIYPYQNTLSFMSYHFLRRCSKLHFLPNILPTPATYISCTHDLHLALNLSSSILDLQKVHAHIVRSNLYSDGFLGDQLVSRYAKSGLRDAALQLFDEIPIKDLASWNSAISALSQYGADGESLAVFRRLISGSSLKPNCITVMSILPCVVIQGLNMGRCVHGFVDKCGLLLDVKVVNSLVNMYGKCGAVDVACGLFERMSVKSLVSWNSIIAIHASNGCTEEVFQLFNAMRRAEFGSDRATMVSLLNGCASLAAARRGRAVHGFILRSGFGSDVPVASALINFYAKSGDLDSSSKVFHEINHPDTIAWTTMIASYAMHGQGREAIDVFLGMVDAGSRPDHVTFTHVLCACSHSGLVEEGKKYFNAMVEDYGIQPRVDHYSCMVDLLGRAGKLFEARELIENMPIEPNSGVWGALLGSCRLHRDIKLGTEAAEKLFSLDPLDARNYIILSNMYSKEGLWDEASKIRSVMKERSLRKDPGCSFIEHENKIVSFVVGDNSHPDSNKIYAKLEELTLKMRVSGYIPMTEYVLHDVDEELKEGMVSIHSEKIAIAFGLLVVSNGAPILIMKNLRICGDCHLAAKFVSSIEKRTLIIRDSKRFHHFADGKCSCGDYW